MCRVTVETVADGVEEGRQAVSKAFTALVRAGYLHRERGQDPETGLWCTQTHVSDIPTDHIPTVGDPKDRGVSDSPKGENTQGKNLLLATVQKGDGEGAIKASGKEEGEESQGKQPQAVVMSVPGEVRMAEIAGWHGWVTWLMPV